MLGVGWGVPTRPQRNCDPASLVLFVFSSSGCQLKRGVDKLTVFPSSGTISILNTLLELLAQTYATKNTTKIQNKMKEDAIFGDGGGLFRQKQLYLVASKENPPRKKNTFAIIINRTKLHCLSILSRK